MEERIMTVRDLVQELMKRPMEAPVMVAVIKYPHEFQIQFKEGSPRWIDHSDVECIPLMFDDEGDADIQEIDGIVHISVELEEFNAERHALGGAGDGR